MPAHLGGFSRRRRRLSLGLHHRVLLLRRLLGTLVVVLWVTVGGMTGILLRGRNMLRMLLIVSRRWPLVWMLVDLVLSVMGNLLMWMLMLDLVGLHVMVVRGTMDGLLLGHLRRVLLHQVLLLMVKRSVLRRVLLRVRRNLMLRLRMLLDLGWMLRRACLLGLRRMLLLHRWLLGGLLLWHLWLLRLRLLLSHLLQ